MPRSTLARAGLIAAIIFLADRISKIWIIEAMDLRNRLYIPVADPWLSFRMAWNTGINFGILDMGDTGRWLLIGVALAIITGLIVWARKTRGWGAAIGTGAIIGGAVGNVWDRVQYGAVADFVNMSCCGIRNPFSFNIADAAIFAGVAVLLLFSRDGSAAPTGRNGA